MNTHRIPFRPSLAVPCFAILALLAAVPGAASSHREAPLTSTLPAIDGTDFYMFNSYEAGRNGFVTLIANYIPLQDSYGGPNYFSLDPAARYRIHIDNDGDSTEDLTFEFRTSRVNNDIALPIGAPGEEQLVSIPLLTAGQLLVAPGGLAAQNTVEFYTVDLVRGPIDAPTSRESVENATAGGTLFCRPLDNAGLKTIPDYDAYAQLCQAEIAIPGCGSGGRAFVGQRKEPFQVNLGEIFDLVNIGNPIGFPDAESSSTAYKNVTALILEVPTACLTGGHGPVIGAWTTAALPANRQLRKNPTFSQPTDNFGAFIQVSRLGMPLVNEVVIGLKDKDLFNASHPKDDLQFATYVTNPVLPELLEILFGVGAPNNFPRTDLLAAFITGVAGLNEFGFGDMLRLNTSIAATPAEEQNRLGVLGGDNAGFPNGRRPGDDVVDAELRVAMGVLCHAFPGVFCEPADAAAGALPFTDGALNDPSQFDVTFPYLKSPVPGSPNSVNGIGGE